MILLPKELKYDTCINTEINAEKSKVISKDGEPLRILADERELNKVSQFRYLKILINRNHCIKKIRRRIAMAKVAFNIKELHLQKIGPAAERKALEMLRAECAIIRVPNMDYEEDVM